MKGESEPRRRDSGRESSETSLVAASHVTPDQEQWLEDWVQFDKASNGSVMADLKAKSASASTSNAVVGLGVVGVGRRIEVMRIVRGMRFILFEFCD
ncbi:hypothetical protein QJS10_CPA09g01132 [Acorus calamus]|uniref:Uncharacterized protein n=1 Tax=Acorus calamus TaxID=4465 RepID=A0AAV9E2A0_ACOCL|nr:hypothetical protein QJS10_CPA09g01132 [Acorus calamus]